MMLGNIFKYINYKVEHTGSFYTSHWTKTTQNVVEGCLVSACTLLCAYLSGDVCYKQLSLKYLLIPLQ